MRNCRLAGWLLVAASFACSSEPPASVDGGVDSGIDGGVDGGDPQSTYTYPGCANTDLGCPRLPTLYCALETILDRHSTCTQDADCAFATFETKCSGFPTACPPPSVNSQARQQFEAEFQAEIDRYCPADGGGCIASEGVCPNPPTAYQPTCVSGKCRARLPDGGM